MNEPVVMVDVIDPNVDAIEKVDLQEKSTPGVYTVDNVTYITIVYFCFAYNYTYIHKLALYKL